MQRPSEEGRPLVAGLKGNGEWENHPGVCRKPMDLDAVRPHARPEIRKEAGSGLAAENL